MDQNAPPSDLQVVILCGGLGTRLSEETHAIPKGMVTIGGRPMLWHLMKYYRSFGFRRFVLCLGYRGDVIKRYFLDYRRMSGSFRVDLDTGDATDIGDGAGIDDWEVVCVDTGEFAMTGARIKRVAPLIDQDSFLLTYGDGLSNVDLHELVDFHQAEDRLVTVTGVHPPARFGNLHLDGSTVTQFSEKIQTEHDFINGGFFVCQRDFLEYLNDDDSCVLERDPLERVSKDGQLGAFLHSGFWQCMDTLRDRELLERMWKDGAKWRRW
jgi:glucose-1-phosphate cytidylyltransferase